VLLDFVKNTQIIRLHITSLQLLRKPNEPAEHRELLRAHPVMLRAHPVIALTTKRSA